MDRRLGAIGHGPNGAGLAERLCRHIDTWGRPSPVQDAGDEARDEEDEALLTAARRAAAEHQDAHGQPITRDVLRARLGVSNQAASELLRQLRAGEGQPPGISRAA